MVLLRIGTGFSSDTGTSTSTPTDTSSSTSASSETSTTDSGSTTSSTDTQSQSTTSNPESNPATTPATTTSATQAYQQGQSQVGTISEATGQVVQNVTPDAPVQTNTGASIVSTQNGQVVLSDGSTVAPEAIGAVTNTDKTITVTKADGTKVTLPETGEAANFLAVVGTGLLGLVGFLFKKKLV